MYKYGCCNGQECVNLNLNIIRLITMTWYTVLNKIKFISFFESSKDPIYNMLHYLAIYIYWMTFGSYPGKRMSNK